MKTLKTTLTVFLLLFTLSSFAQSKEETLEWLKINAKSLSSFTFTYISSGDNCDFHLKVSDNGEAITNSFQWSYDNKPSTPSTNTYSFSDILYQEVNTITRSKDDKYSAYSYEVQIAGGKTLIIKSNENIDVNVKRVLKAIMHLAKLSGAKENKQTF